METISVAITGSSDMRCFDLYLINIFKKSRKAERCTDVMLAFYSFSVTVENLYNEDIDFLVTQYFVLLDAASGA